MLKLVCSLDYKMRVKKNSSHPEISEAHAPTLTYCRIVPGTQEKTNSFHQMTPEFLFSLLDSYKRAEHHRIALALFGTNWNNL